MFVFYSIDEISSRWMNSIFSTETRTFIYEQPKKVWFLPSVRIFANYGLNFI